MKLVEYQRQQRAKESPVSSFMDEHIGQTGHYAHARYTATEFYTIDGNAMYDAHRFVQVAVRYSTIELCGGHSVYLDNASNVMGIVLRQIDNFGDRWMAWRVK